MTNSTEEITDGFCILVALFEWADLTPVQAIKASLSVGLKP
jgi:hypothetical protein